MRKLYILELAAALWLCMAGSVSAEILHMGMRGAAVESLQNDLVEAGYLARTVDGDYGSTTVKAVIGISKRIMDSLLREKQMTAHRQS